MKHTSHEKVFASQLLAQVRYIEQTNTVPDEWETVDVIRTHMRDYLNQIIFIVARLNRSIGEFERHFGPVNVSSLLADEAGMDTNSGDESTPDR